MEPGKVTSKAVVSTCEEKKLGFGPLMGFIFHLVLDSWATCIQERYFIQREAAGPSGRVLTSRSSLVTWAVNKPPPALLLEYLLTRDASD